MRSLVALSVSLALLPSLAAGRMRKASPGQGASRQGAVDSCISLSVNRVAETLSGASSDISPDGIDALCYCSEGAGKLIDQNADLQELPERYGRSHVKATLKQLANSPEGVLCSLPEHSHPICKPWGSEPCAFECEDGFTRRDQTCVCEAPNVISPDGRSCGLQANQDITGPARFVYQKASRRSPVSHLDGSSLPDGEVTIFGSGPDCTSSAEGSAPSAPGAPTGSGGSGGVSGSAGGSIGIRIGLGGGAGAGSGSGAGGSPALDPGLLGQLKSLSSLLALLQGGVPSAPSGVSIDALLGLVDKLLACTDVKSLLSAVGSLEGEINGLLGGNLGGCGCQLLGDVQGLGKLLAGLEATLNGSGGLSLDGALQGLGGTLGKLLASLGIGLTPSPMPSPAPAPAPGHGGGDPSTGGGLNADLVTQLKALITLLVKLCGGSVSVPSSVSLSTLLGLTTQLLACTSVKGLLSVLGELSAEVKVLLSKLDGCGCDLAGDLGGLAKVIAALQGLLSGNAAAGLDAALSGTLAKLLAGLGVALGSAASGGAGAVIAIDAALHAKLETVLSLVLKLNADLSVLFGSTADVVASLEDLTLYLLAAIELLLCADTDVNLIASIISSLTACQKLVAGLTGCGCVSKLGLGQMNDDAGAMASALQDIQGWIHDGHFVVPSGQAGGTLVHHIDTGIDKKALIGLQTHQNVKASGH